MQGNGLPGVLKTAENVVSVPKSWLAPMGWSAGDIIRVTAGKKSVSACVQAHSEDRVAVSNTILLKLKLPKVPMTWKAERNAIRFGPFVAVYCNYNGNSKKPFASITDLLKDMAFISKEMRIPFYVISMGGLREMTKTAVCWVYDEAEDKWLRDEYPWPDFCIRKTISIPQKWRWTAKAESQWIKRECALLYRPLGSKFNVYQLLSKDPAILPHLPKTGKLHSLENVLTMLEQFPVLYIKPSRGTQGKSVYRFSRQILPGVVRIEFRQGEFTRAATVNLADKAAWFRKHFLSRQEFLVQQGICLLADRQGRPADFRWLLQKDGSGIWKITARVARLGQKGSVTTNVSTGADVLDAADFLAQAGFSPHKIASMIRATDNLAFLIVRRLEQHVGPMGELGIDFGLDREGCIWLIEVNPNPGRKMLKLLDPKVRALSLQRPLEYARYTVGFGNREPEQIPKR